MPSTESQGYSLNAILRVAAISGLILNAAIFIFLGGNQYSSFSSVAAGSVLYVQVFLMLLLESRCKNPFLLLFSLLVLFFYAGRVTTLLIIPYSPIFQYNAAASAAILKTILYIIAANFFIVGGLCSDFIKAFPIGPRKISFHGSEPFVAISAVWLGALYTLLIISLGDVSSNTTALRLKGYAGILFNGNVLISAAAVVWVYSETFYGVYKKAFLWGVTAYLALQTVAGSRSVLLSALMTVLFVFLAGDKPFLFRKKTLFAAGGVILFGFLAFSVGTYFRWGNTYGGALKSENLVKYRIYLPYISPLKAFSRIGFLDSTVDLMANAAKYSAVINPAYYFKSVVDNALTPGFEVFHAPKAANALRFLYMGLPLPTHAEVRCMYQADMFTGYGDLYVLSGPYFSLLLFYILAAVFRNIYALMGARGDIFGCVQRVLLLTVFANWVNGFGLDWMAAEVLAIFLSFFLFRKAAGILIPGVT
ncbi:MAG: hypothetical protein A2270_04595 [Elusimicrobia bacterium RIFOXYA12_FULL_51_18]|nr:MAG: hypothetical protein A2270_04595 [Elusimicrobia bacterium RIFOXYA12_FULL_51_18]OGS32856.1 MAG: hypothetical protein A2218_10650 [Elusimicrobia bacterium RIFOXYA2_FULL_53_38]